MNSKYAAIGLLVIGVILVVGGIVLSAIGTGEPDWVGKSIAIIVGALVALAGGSQVISQRNSNQEDK
jgi:hypothetical protein